MDFPDVTIDDDCQLRILNPEVHERSTGLAEECQLLVSKVREFQTIMATINSEMNRLAKDTERQKLKAIGRRMKLEHHSSEDALRREEAILMSRIESKEKEREEFSSYTASLGKAEREQLEEIEKLEGRGA
mmetsp:Transcript_34787/g.73368  ORF Transcript_34787/g.73368 Transcript_34787/m.73368 type:complete len:131 (+) Transcript_34787:74-466(+)